MDKKKDPALFKDIRRDNIEEQFGGTAPNMPQENENGFFPPRMPSEHFIKEDENINDILITEDEYINKFKNGEIPEEIISPYIYQKLKLEEKKVQNNLSDKIEKNSEKISSEIKSFQNSNKIYKKSTIHTEEKSNTEKIKDLKNEQLLKIQSTLLKKQNEKTKIQNILNNGWYFDDELSFNKYNNKTASLKYNNLLDDINKLGKKKQKFISKISLVNGNKSSIYNH